MKPVIKTYFLVLDWHVVYAAVQYVLVQVSGRLVVWVVVG